MLAVLPPIFPLRLFPNKLLSLHLNSHLTTKFMDEILSRVETLKERINLLIELIHFRHKFLVFSKFFLAAS